MATVSSIEWTETTWNPVTGCTKISAGCLHCYAERMARRLQGMGQARYRKGFEVTLQPEALPEPYGWKRPRRVFVNSMSDLFHEEIPFEYLRRVFRVMNDNPRHTFQILTKRSRILRELAGQLEWTPNIWMGVTVERGDFRYRMDDLRTVPAAVRFVSMEPLLGPIVAPDLRGIDWVIVGGESGPGARPMEECWAVDLQKACEDQAVAFFFKQWGGVNKKKAGRILQGQLWDQYPTPVDRQLVRV
jgi:protein gp37